MRKLFFFPLLFLAAVCHSQVIADPATSQEILTNLTDTNQVNPLLVPLNGIVKLKIPVYNRSLINALPAGACKIKIGLGSKIRPDASFDLATALPGSYFSWTKEFVGGQYQITGELVTSLPADYTDTAIFNVQGDILGNSTITTNFLITNHNTSLILSDENPNNNSSFLPYTVVETTPVNFTGISVIKSGCSIAVNFTAENEINVKKYEIERSTDGINFTKASEIIASNLIGYKTSFTLSSGITADNIFIRLKSVDLDGRYQLSETRTISGICDEPLLVALFPNPVITNQALTIQAKQGWFNGNYVCRITDIAGKLVYHKTLTNLSNVKQFFIEPSNLSKGKYFVQIQNANSLQSFFLQFQKL